MNDFYLKLHPNTKALNLFLEYIENDKISTSYNNVTKTNWKTNNSAEKDLQLIFDNFLYEDIKNVLGKDFKIKDTWYQLYGSNTNSKHIIHNHLSFGCDYVVIYYLKLKDKKLTTQFFIDDETIQPEMEEGDLIIFPSNILHSSPKNDTNYDKIILSVNIDTKMMEIKKNKTII
jgi:hypothetical protein